MNKKKIKELGKRAVQNGYMSADEFKQHARKYILRKTLGPVKGPDDTGIRIMGAGRTKSHVKGHHRSVPHPLIKVKGNNVEFKDLHLDIQRDVKDKKKKMNNIETKVIHAPGHRTGLDIIRCTINAQDQRVIRIGGRKDAYIYRSDLIGSETQLHTASFVRIDRCDFYGATDTWVMIYSHGGWCNSVTNSRFMNANPEWPAVGRWFTVSAGWQVSENLYLGNNVSKNLMPREDFHDQNMTDTPVGMTFVSGRYGKTAEPLYGHLGLFNNVLRLGKAKKPGSIGIHLFTEKNLHRTKNTVEGFETNWKVGK